MRAVHCAALNHLAHLGHFLKNILGFNSLRKVLGHESKLLCKTTPFFIRYACVGQSKPYAQFFPLHTQDNVESPPHFSTLSYLVTQAYICGNFIRNQHTKL